MQNYLLEATVTKMPTRKGHVLKGALKQKSRPNLTDTENCTCLW